MKTRNLSHLARAMGLFNRGVAHSHQLAGLRRFEYRKPDSASLDVIYYRINGIPGDTRENVAARIRHVLCAYTQGPALAFLVERSRAFKRNKTAPWLETLTPAEYNKPEELRAKGFKIGVEPGHVSVALVERNAHGRFSIAPEHEISLRYGLDSLLPVKRVIARPEFFKDILPFPIRRAMFTSIADEAAKLAKKIVNTIGEESESSLAADVLIVPLASTCISRETILQNMKRTRDETKLYHVVTSAYDLQALKKVICENRDLESVIRSLAGRASLLGFNGLDQETREIIIAAIACQHATMKVCLGDEGFFDQWYIDLAVQTAVTYIISEMLNDRYFPLFAEKLGLLDAAGYASIRRDQPRDDLTFGLN